MLTAISRYCKDGISPKVAVDRVKQSLNSISQDANDDIVVVIDTCGENTSAKEFTIFGVNFAGWKKVDIFANLDKQNMKG